MSGAAISGSASDSSGICRQFAAVYVSRPQDVATALRARNVNLTRDLYSTDLVTLHDRRKS